MRDLLPAQVELRDHCASVIARTYERFGYRRVETPAVEHIELLTGSGGGENEKLIFRILKRGEKLDLGAAGGLDELVEFGLRYDLTVPLARFYAEHAAELPSPFRALQIGPVWRAERPQRGRFRQFTQCDIDILGEAGELAEVELIQATSAALAALGLTGFTVRLNDRRLLAALVAGCGFAEGALPDVFIAVDKLDKLGLAGVLEELAGQGHEAGVLKRLQAALEAALAPEAARSVPVPAGVPLGAAGEAAAARLLAVRALAAPGLPAGVELLFDPTLVRGMGYYTGALFEVSVPGYPFSFAGGGRYDRMLGGLIGREVPACGFSIGFERVVLALEERGVQPAERPSRVALLHAPELPAAEVVAAAQRLREAGRAVATLPQRKKLSRQLDELAGQGFDGFVVLEAGRAPDVRSFQSA
jgi:histidyl-tRNA synthetase